MGWCYSEMKVIGRMEMYTFVKRGSGSAQSRALSSIPTYFLSLFPIPVAVEKCIGKIRRDFLLGSVEGEPNYHHLAKRSMILISSGGLGLKNFIVFIWALMEKWLWQYATKSRSLWQLVVELSMGACEVDGTLIWSTGLLK